METTQTKSLGAILLEHELISEAQLNEALQQQRRWGVRLGEALIRLGYLREELLTWCLASQLQIPCISTIETRPECADLAALDSLSAHQAWRHRCVPLLRSGSELHVVTDDPLDRVGLEQLAQDLALTLSIAAGPPSEVVKALSAFYGPAIADSSFNGPETEWVTGSEKTAPEIFDAWIAQRVRAGQRRLAIDCEHERGQLRTRQNGWLDTIEQLEPALCRALQVMVEPWIAADGGRGSLVRPFHSGTHSGTIAVSRHGECLALLIALPDANAFVIPDAWCQILRSELSAPGLWLIGVQKRRHWNPVVKAITSALEPEHRVQSPDWDHFSEQHNGHGPALQRHLDATLALEPDVLILPASASSRVFEVIRRGIPETAIFLQTPASSPLRAYQMVLSAGLSSPELAEFVKGCLIITMVDQRCATCSLTPERLEPLRWSDICAGMPANPLEMASYTCTSCGGTGVVGELPVFELHEMNDLFADTVLREGRVVSLAGLGGKGNFPTKKAQLDRYFSEQRVHRRIVEEPGPRKR